MCSKGRRKFLVTKQEIQNEHKLADRSWKSSQRMEADNPSHPMVKASAAKTPITERIIWI